MPVPPDQQPSDADHEPQAAEEEDVSASEAASELQSDSPDADHTPSDTTAESEDAVAEVPQTVEDLETVIRAQLDRLTKRAEESDKVATELFTRTKPWGAPLRAMRAITQGKNEHVEQISATHRAASTASQRAIAQVRARAGRNFEYARVWVSARAYAWRRLEANTIEPLESWFEANQQQWKQSQERTEEIEQWLEAAAKRWTTDEQA